MGKCCHVDKKMATENVLMCRRLNLVSVHLLFVAYPRGQNCSVLTFVFVIVLQGHIAVTRLKEFVAVSSLVKKIMEDLAEN